MQTIDETLRAAVDLHRAGNIEQAASIYRQILEANPRHAPTLHLLGTANFQVGQYQLAIEQLHAAIRIDAGRPEYQATLTEVLRASGRLNEAIASAKRLVQLTPESPEAHFIFGRLLEAGSDLDSAAREFAETLRLAPSHLEAMLHLGQAFHGQGNLAEAGVQFEAAALQHPQSPWAHCGVGAVFQGQGKLDDAVAAYQRAIERDPNLPQAHYNLGVALRLLDRLPEAAASLQTALRLLPTLAEAHLALSNVYLTLVRPDEAVAAACAALDLAPNSGLALARLAAALQLQGEADAAIAAYRRGVVANPGNAAEHSNLLYALNFDPHIEPAKVFAEHRAWAERHAEPLTAVAAPHANDRDPRRRLRVGYVSPHFREHAVSFFSEPMILAHDPAECEIYCYSDVRAGDACTERFRARADGWRDTAGQSDEQVAGQVREDQIDILVDLAGHIGGNRLLVFARKPAPVQVTYLGYQNTTGMSAMDYRLTDEHANPSGMSEKLYTERLERLPDSFYCFAPSSQAPPVNPPPAIANGFITFASLNHINKLRRETLHAWAQILKSTPNSRLLVLGYAPGRFEANVRDVMTRAGVDPSRLRVVNKRPRQDYLRMHHEIDIALDTFPFNGHTTVCDALWMGVPSIMLEGNTYASRFGGTALVHLGLRDLIAGSQSQYIQIAAALAADLPRLTALRSDLRERMRNSVLLDAQGFTRRLEAAYRRMWASWCEHGSAATAKIQARKNP
jgi:protein O-GlcNAc transferase